MKPLRPAGPPPPTPLGERHGGTGDHRHALTLTELVAGALEPLRHNRIVAAAMGELVREVACGTLTLDLVRQVKAAIEAERSNARARREWRALAATG